MSGEDIKLLLCNCPLLEELIIGDTFLRSDVELCGANLHLNHLEIYYCSGIKSVKVSAPNLTWMEVDNTMGKLLLENVPRLVGASIRIQSGMSQIVKSFGSDVFSCISSQLKSLNLTLHSPKKFLANGVYKMPKLKKLVVGYYERFGTMSKDRSAPPLVASNVERSPHQHLKVFELAGFPGDYVDHVDELVTCIFTNCVALEKIIFSRSSWAQYKYNEILCNSHAARDYGKQRQLQAKLPPHILLQLP